MKNILGQRYVSLLQELPDEIRKIIIQNLGKNVSELPQGLDTLGKEYFDTLMDLFVYTSQNPSIIPEIRYELETYTNDLDPDFSAKFVEENKGRLVRVLDLGAGPGDVTLRSYKKLVRAGLVPQVFALERSGRFRSELIKKAKNEGIVAMERDKILGTETYPGIFSIPRDMQDLRRETLWSVQLVVGNYVLDRVSQKRLLEDIQDIGNIQFTNCVPLQYQNPNTGQSYIPESEIIIPEGANDLSAIGNALNLKDAEMFSGTNTVTSLQDGEEKFNYAGIRGEL